VKPTSRDLPCGAEIIKRPQSQVINTLGRVKIDAEGPWQKRHKIWRKGTKMRIGETTRGATMFLLNNVPNFTRFSLNADIQPPLENIRTCEHILTRLEEDGSCRAASLQIVPLEDLQLPETR
jgi:hypothetical protein